MHHITKFKCTAFYGVWESMKLYMYSAGMDKLLSAGWTLVQTTNPARDVARIQLRWMKRYTLWSKPIFQRRSSHHERWRHCGNQAFVFRFSPIQISARRPVTPIEVYRVLLRPPPPAHPGKCQYSALKWATAESFHILYNSLLIYIIIIGYIV
jgi:hypothetical protein